ncbi:MAG: glycoside hydrolase family 18 protein [Steroidobacteraceae bacterium]
MSSPAFGSGFTVSNAINTWISRGFPASKLNLGLAFYARGWSGVPNGGARGLYQPVSGPSPSFPFSQQEGVAFYKELKAAGLLTNSNVYFDTITASAWLYDGSNFYGLEVPHSLRYKLEYVKQKGLGGIMIYSLEDDDADSTLFKAATGATN